MALLEILTAPDPVLKQKAEPVDEVNDEIRTLLDDMLETMYDAPGIGLAAPQIGVLKNVIVVDVHEEGEDPKPLKMVNPEVTWSSEDMGTYEEGCLSVPQSYSEVERPAQIKVTYLDENGAKMDLEADGLLATCIQHELDHLNGKLFIDYLSKLKRDRVVKKFTKQAKLAGRL